MWRGHGMLCVNRSSGLLSCRGDDLVLSMVPIIILAELQRPQISTDVKFENLNLPLKFQSKLAKDT